jgi:hypothetical protein
MKRWFLAALLFTSACDSNYRDMIFDCSKDPCEDCAFIDSKLKGRKDYNFSVDDCRMCQGTACDPMSCQNFPCQDNKRVVRACNVDRDCKPMMALCGHYASMHNVCVTSDGI